MANRTSQFVDLKLVNSNSKVGGISEGLEIKGVGTFVFDIEDDNGALHTIKIPNSLYLPKLKLCLLLPQHWAQEARDEHPHPRGTRMENDAHGCVLIWRQGQYTKTVPFDPLTNTPVFRTAAATHSYHAFTSFFDAEPTPSHHHRVVAFNAQRHLQGLSPPLPDEFIAEENHLIDTHDATVTEGFTADDATVGTSTLPPSLD